MRRLGLIGASAMTALLLVACASSTNPGVVDVSRRQLLIVPADTVEQMAEVNFREQNAKAKAAGKLVEQGADYQRISAILARLEPQAVAFRPDAARWHWELALIDSPVLNASCGPGGKITVYTGLIHKLGLTDDEIAIVLGHEMAHALREHGRERISQALAQDAISKVALGAMQDKAAQIELANQFAQYLYVLPNSRQDETEADKIGLELAARAGYNPAAAISVWRKMEAADKGGQAPEFLSTHPANDTRIAELTRLQPAVLPLYQAARRQ